MAKKTIAQATARKLRKKHPNKTVNVVEITKGNWGCRFSPKGKRDTKYNRKPTGVRRKTKRSKVESSRKKYDRGGRIEAYTFGEAVGSKKWP